MPFGGAFDFTEDGTLLLDGVKQYDIIAPYRKEDYCVTVNQEALSRL